ncbi:polymer-forming cytoskeletal protein [Persicimonas caeni]|uniref:Polymer-forming cytoskeletal protein n=1 Tax=Persicimonas caeni TaxID=2292766 RepID=A0A4Y6PN89_PERCE|nr:polymer-forming cytoskeletal protein [Persicimonas caeni]QDG49776.1 polymer-forming cytoskeletal protein [Persicimonas caeni]QED30997.1 polymer-forming cytoskeletal protein [Persicimonas caeni]
MAPADSCTIGPQITVSGRLTGDQEVTVQGTIEGTVALDNQLTVDEGGRVVADVEADTVVVQGYLEGDVVAREVVQLLAGCTVTGNIRAPRINIEEGARFRGNIDMDVAMPATE